MSNTLLCLGFTGKARLAQEVVFIVLIPVMHGDENVLQKQKYNPQIIIPPQQQLVNE